MHKVYLDNNATTYRRPESLKIMNDVLQAPLNASAVHYFGQTGRKHVEQAREQVAKLCHVDPTQVIFNSGATEGNNTVLQHFAKDRILVSAIEHPSVLEAAPNAPRIPALENGAIDLNALEDLLKEEKAVLVSVMFANNETGIIQPVSQISALCKQYGAFFHCDAVQAAGRLPLSLSEYGIDFLTLSAHKIGGPQGVGALVLGFCGETPTLLHGGSQEKQARAGTENVAGITGFGVAAELAQNNLSSFQNLSQFRDQIEQNILAMAPAAKIYGSDQNRVANTTLFSLQDISSDRVMMAFDLEGIALSNGSACTSGTIQPSHVLQAMGCSEAESSSAIRISTGWNTTQEDIDRFCEVWPKLYKRIQK